jgi:TPR repeat protein
VPSKVLLRPVKDDSLLITQEELIGIQNNDPIAMQTIGNKYHMQQSFTRSMEWYLRSASLNNNPHACCMIGLQYMMGQGVPVDYQKTMEWHLKAANQGIATAQYRVGKLIEASHGTHGTSKQDALTWYHKSMDNGYAEANVDISRLNGEGYFLKAEQMGKSLIKYKYRHREKKRVTIHHHDSYTCYGKADSTK